MRHVVFDLGHVLLNLGHVIVGLISVFLGRHWLVGIANAGLTSLLGLSLLNWAQRWRTLQFSSVDFLRLRRLVLLVAISKGAFYLLLGTSFVRRTSFPLLLGIQFPDPISTLGLVSLSADSIWSPTSATKWVSLLLLCTASACLGRRLLQLLRSTRTLRTLLRVDRDLSEPRVTAALQRAIIFAAPAPRSIPHLLLAEIPYPTPTLVGVRRPYLILSPRLARLLSDAELEMAFRHELAHVNRADHRWRWLFTWLEDVGQLNLLSSRLSHLALETEEQLCDRLSVQTPQEALVLAQAIRKSVDFHVDKFSTAEFHSATLSANEVEGSKTQKDAYRKPFQNTSSYQSDSASSENGASEDNAAFDLSLPERGLPALLGRHTRKWSRPSSLEDRLQALLRLAEELAESHMSSSQAIPESSLSHTDSSVPSSYPTPSFRERSFRERSFKERFARRGTRLAFGFLLLLVFYVKVYIGIVLP